MSRIVYLNGKYLEAEDAKISIFDRAVLFGDAVYEVAGVIDGKLIDFDNHFARLIRSLTELAIPRVMSREEILAAYRALVKLNQVSEGLVYLQITRGEEEREFVYGENLTPTIFMFTQHKPPKENQFAESGVTLKSVPDIRWARRDIKSVNLLGQVLAKRTANESGAYEALMIDNGGFVTECGATSFFIVRNNILTTRPLGREILPGVTRAALIKLASEREMILKEEVYKLEAVYSADEAFISGASTYVLPVIKVDNIPIGSGIPGNIAQQLRQMYIEHARATAI